MSKAGGEMPQQCLTHSENVNIILRLRIVEAREKKLARQVVGLQVVIALVVAGGAYALNGSLPYALAMLSGSFVSAVNGALLAWRMSRAALQVAPESHCPGSAHWQLRLMYFYAAERFLMVVALLGMCLAVLKLTPLAVLGGFVVGQAALLAARLIFIRLN